MKFKSDIIVVGGGIFGVTAALELTQRGHRVAVLDIGQLPNPLASSTDISKVVRIEYGADEVYGRFAEAARLGWLKWNEEFGEDLYHEVGLVMLTRAQMKRGEYEYENYHSLVKRGFQPERLDSLAIAKRFPAFRPGVYTDGYFSNKGGYVESRRVLDMLIARVARQGVIILPENRVTNIIITSGRARGVKNVNGETFESDQILVAAGAWTPYLLPELRPHMCSVGMPVFHLRPADPTLFRIPHLTVFSADVTRSGWYGFPYHPKEKVVKIAYHGTGKQLHPVRDKRIVSQHEEQRFREFIAESIPALKGAQRITTRCCLYCDTLDENFWIARHPNVSGLTVAAGGSGHAFKFGPLLGRWIADVLEGKLDSGLDRFSWRELSDETVGVEASRHREQP